MRAEGVSIANHPDIAAKIKVRFDKIQRVLKSAQRHTVEEEITINFTALAMMTGVIAAAAMASELDVADDEQLQKYKDIVLRNFDAGFSMAMKKARGIGGQGIEQ